MVVDWVSGFGVDGSVDLAPGSSSSSEELISKVDLS